MVGPFAAKLSEVQHDRAVDYLPASAGSTQVAKIQERLPGGETTELVLVYHREGGLTAADRAAAEARVEQIAERDRLVAEPEGVPSEDGETLMYPVAGNGPGTDEELRDAFVERVREVARSDGGLTVEVGGPGAGARRGRRRRAGPQRGRLDRDLRRREGRAPVRTRTSPGSVCWC